MNLNLSRKSSYLNVFNTIAGAGFLGQYEVYLLTDRLCANCPLRLCQNESSCETIYLKMCSACRLFYT